MCQLMAKERIYQLNLKTLKISFNEVYKYIIHKTIIIHICILVNATLFEDYWMYIYHDIKYIMWNKY